MAPLTVSLVLYRPEPALLRATLAALEVASQRFGAAAVVDQEEVRLQIGPPAGRCTTSQATVTWVSAVATTSASTAPAIST